MAKITIEKRMSSLLEVLLDVISNPVFDHHITIKYLYYPCTQCTTPRECSFQHMDQFKTMLDYGSYINITYPLALVGTGQHPGPSVNALH